MPDRQLSAQVGRTRNFTLLRKMPKAIAAVSASGMVGQCEILDSERPACRVRPQQQSAGEKHQQFIKRGQHTVRAVMAQAGKIGAQKKNHLHQHLVRQQDQQQQQFAAVIAHRPGQHQGNEKVYNTEQYLDCQQVGEIFRQQLRVLADVPVVKALNAEIIENLKNIGQIHQRKIQSVFLARPVLHRQVDPKNKKRLYQQVDKEQEKDVDDKFAVHGSKGRP